MSNSTERLTRNWIVEEKPTKDTLVLKNDDTGRDIELDRDGVFENVLHVASVDDLPEASNGTHTLPDTPVLFTDFVSSSDALELGDPSPLLGYHGGASGFIYTGGGGAIRGSGVPCFVDSLSFTAPNGQLFDIDADADTEHLWYDSSVSDFAGLGETDLGIIDGYRVPSFKSVNFEDISGSLTFDGTLDKIFFSGCPFRNVTQSGVSFIEFASTLEVDLVDINGGFMKDVQSDTNFLLDNGATINNVLQYVGQTHDTTVTKDNVITGPDSSTGVRPEDPGVIVDNSYPLANSQAIAEMALDPAASPATTTISSQDTYTPIEGATVLGAESELFDNPNAGELRYIGKRDVKIHLETSVSVFAGTDTFAVAISVNGTPSTTTEVQQEGQGSNAPVSADPGAVEKLSINDIVRVEIKNIDSTTNLDVVNYNVRGS